MSAFFRRDAPPAPAGYGRLPDNPRPARSSVPTPDAYERRPQQPPMTDGRQQMPRSGRGRLVHLQFLYNAH